MSVFLTVVIPAYNEAKRLPATLRAVHAYCRNLEKPYEVLVIDDGSSDETASVAGDLQAELPHLRILSHHPNRGKGYAVRQGILESQGEFVLFMDADHSTSIDELNLFLPALLAGNAVVIATRKHKGAQILLHQPLLRESMGKTFTLLSNVILGLHISDFTCGFKAFESSAAIKVAKRLTLDGWAFDSEVLFLANRYGFKILEIPVKWINSPESKVRLWSATAGSLLALFRIRLNALLGKYDDRTEPSGRTIQSEERFRS